MKKRQNKTMTYADQGPSNFPSKNVENTDSELETEPSIEPEISEPFLVEALNEPVLVAALVRFPDAIPVKTQNVPLKPKFDKVVEYSINESRIYAHGFIGVGYVRIYAQTKGGVKSKLVDVPASGYVLFENDFEGEIATEIITVKSGGILATVIKGSKVAPSSEVLTYLDKTIPLAVAKANCVPCGQKKAK